MKRHSFMTVVFAAFIFLLSCDSNRPESKGEFNYSLKVSSIQILAEVEIKEGDEVIQSGVTDESGDVVFSDVKALTDLTVKICGGTVKLISSTEPVAWTGCMEASFKPVDVDEISVTVDILSTFISKYDSETRIEEFQEYLDITTLPAPALQTSLTDATKRYLWYQGIAKTAENVSKANAVTPETMYSTENLLNLLYADLVDDAIINGSTKAKFGSLTIEASILKNILADAIPSVDKAFSATDLKSWTDKIRTSEAKFLGGEGSGTDSEKPVIEIISPAGENAIVFGNVAVEASATDNKEITSLNCSITGEGMPELTDSVEDPASFKAEFDSTSIPDSKITIKCIASDGTNLSEKEISVTISNSNTASLKAFITNELTLWDSVTVYNMTGTKIQTVSFVEDEETKTVLAPGIYRFVFKGGTYKPVFLADDTIEFDSSLETRGEVKAGETTNIIATPLTTLREYLYRALTEKSDAEAQVKSLTLISEHIDSDFPLYIEPVSKNQLTENSKYYIALAAFERLAVLVGERHEPALEAGAITIEQVLKALTDDLKNETKAVLDGGDTINQFPVDSYLFRYWYSIALKLFLESDENLTGLKFSDLQTVISNISMDESELFPEADKAKKVTDRPPVISEKQFKRFFETEYQNYSVENIIYANSSFFSVKFKAVPASDGNLILDSTWLYGDIEVQSISDINEDGDYLAQVKFPAGIDGNKSIEIRVVDNAENTGTAVLQGVLDTVNPIITNFGDLLPANVTTPLPVSYSTTDLNPMDALYTVVPANETPLIWISLSPAVLSGEITITDSILADDGAYTLHFKAVDKAGNETVQTKALLFDRIKPAATFTTIPEINENGFIARNSVEITVFATDNITSENELIHEFFNNVSWVENPGEIKNVWNMQMLSEELYERKYRVKDLAGNRSADINITFTVDMVKPVLTTSKTTLESRAYSISDEMLMLNSTCSDTNVFSYSYTINDGDPVTISDVSMPLTNNMLLSEGTNIIVVNCTDKAGNYAEETIYLVIDNTSPVVSFASSPVEGSTVCDLNQNIVVKAIDGLSRPVKAKYWYSINGLTNSSIYEVFLNETGVASLTFPATVDTFYNDTEKYKNRINNVSFFVVINDEAFNNSENTVINWSFDRLPPKGIVLDGLSSYYAATCTKAPVVESTVQPDVDNAEKWFSDSCPDVAGMRFFVNDVLKSQWDSPDYECLFYPCNIGGNFYTPCVICLLENNTLQEFNMKVTFSDLCGNSGEIINCKDNDFFCVSQDTNTGQPDLYVDLNQAATDNFELLLSTKADIISCKIKKNGADFKNCSNLKGIQNINTSTWSEGSYTVEAESKYSNGALITRKSKGFTVDRTPFSITISNDNYKPFYLTLPRFNFNIKIASGVKEVKFYIEDRSVNPLYAASDYIYDDGYMRKANYRSEVATAHTASGSFNVFISEGGIYKKISFRITPNFGSVVSGEKVLGDQPLRIVKDLSENIRAWEGPESNRLYFSESIISRSIDSSSVWLIAEPFSRMCKHDERFFHKLVSTSLQVEKSLNLSDRYISFEKGSFTYRWISSDNNFYGLTCSGAAECPSTIVAGCSTYKDDEKYCRASKFYYYSDSGKQEYVKSDGTVHSCDCSNFSGLPLCYENRCRLLKDHSFIPDSSQLYISDDFQTKTFNLKSYRRINTVGSDDCNF